MKRFKMEVVMELIDYTNKWLTGEIYEDLAILVTGIVMLVLVVAAWRFGSSVSARAVIVPLLVATALFIGGGAALAANNSHRRVQFEQEYKESPQKFLESEKARVDAFMKIYPQTIIYSAVMMIIAVCVFAFCTAPWLRASALVLILVALAALTIDFFSKERGEAYQQELNSIQIESLRQ